MKPLTSNLDIVTAEAELWKTWRSRFNPGFSSRNIMALLPDLIEDVAKFANVLEGLAGEGNTWGPVFQLKEKATNLTFDSICKITFGIGFNQQSVNTDTPLKAAILYQIHLMATGSDSLQGLVYRRTPWHKAMIDKNNRIIENLIKPLIHANLQEESNNSHIKTVVELAFRNINRSETTLDLSPSQPDARLMDIIISNIKAFIFAGQDTTASTICFLFKNLQDNQECLRRLRAEHDAVLGPDQDKIAEILTADRHLIYNLPYTLGVIKETLRLYPLASTARQGSPDMFLTVPNSPTRYPLDGFAPWIAVASIHQSPDYWDRPTEFLPERWMRDEKDPLYPRKDAWMPFSLGPRSCIGMELALVELKLVCIFTARTLSIEEAWAHWDEKRGSQATPGHVVNGRRLYEVDTGPVQPKDGMPVHVKLREKTSRL
ncbi:hypothetical protein DL769_001149 [Monosporascus sp. CRB-8-3]|nr:hypothetical protein DL769_001149 [Monosporascus sp. CRB-8-3]